MIIVDPKQSKYYRGTATTTPKWFEQFPIFSAISGEKSKVRCDACQCDINVGKGSISQLKKHVDTEKHKKSASALKGVHPLDSHQQDSIHHKRYRAELIYCYHMIEHDR